MDSKLQGSELDWLAFCYIANELSAEDHKAFEERLADDQQAREAVARAVELTQNLAAIPVCEQIVERPRVTVAGRHSDSWRRAVYLAVGGVACLLLLLAFVVNRDGGSPDSGDPAIADKNSERLAFAWVETLDETVSAELEEPFLLAAETDDETLTRNDAEFASFNEAGDDESIATPDWMLAAVSGLAAEAASGEIKEQ